MEHKTWLWRRKPSEKTIVGEKSDLSLSSNGQEKEKALEWEKLLEDMNDQLSSVHAEANAKDDILTKQAKVAEEAIKGRVKAESEAASFKKERDDALLQKVAAEEKMLKTDTSLKECMQQLRIVNEREQNVIDNAAMKISREQEKARALEKRLEDATRKLANLDFENSNLNEVLEVREKLIEGLTEYKSHSEADFEAIVARLDSSEKTNASLMYEVRMLQKELEIRNDERQFNLKSAEAAQRQHLESIKKITKLKTECQRLRVLVRKQLPGPAALSKMRNEVELLANNSSEIRRRTSNPGESFIASLNERLWAIEEENKILKETLTRKNSELQSSRAMFAHRASKLSQAETQLEELSKAQVDHELSRSNSLSYDLVLASMSKEGGSEDDISTAGSWASALISELEHFKSGKATTSSCKNAGALDISLMDDFLEMEKLAMVCANKPTDSSGTTSRENHLSVVPKEIDSRPDLLEALGKELVPIDNFSGLGGKGNENQSSYISLEQYPTWLQDILRVILEKHSMTKRSLDSILEEVRAALSKKPSDAFDVNHNSHKPQHSYPDLFNGTFGMAMHPSETNNQVIQSSLEKSVSRLIDLTEGIIQRLVTNKSSQQVTLENVGRSAPNYKSSSLIGCKAHAFLLKSSEVNLVLEHFVTVCNDLLYGKADFKKFLGELTLTLEWIINHCFYFQDASHMEEMIKKHFDDPQPLSDNEPEAGINHTGSEVDKRDASEEPELKVQRSSPLLTSSNNLHILMQMEEIESKVKDENKRLRYDIMNMESGRKDLDERLGSASAKNASLINQPHEPGENISNLQVKLEKLKESKGIIEDQIENQKLIHEDLGTQVTVAKVELNKDPQKFSSPEVELENKSNCCEKLEATCLELQLQLESVTPEEIPKYNKGPEEKQFKTDCEISAASEKLAECQETIRNLGKQLKALASAKDAALFDKVISTSTEPKSNLRLLLLDQTRAEDDAKFEELKFPETKEIICTELQKLPTATSDNPHAGFLFGHKILRNNGTTSTIASIIQQPPMKSSEKLSGSYNSNKHEKQNDVGTLAIVPKRQKSAISLLKRLLTIRRRDSSKKVNLQKVTYPSPICRI